MREESENTWILGRKKSKKESPYFFSLIARPRSGEWYDSWSFPVTHYPYAGKINVDLCLPCLCYRYAVLRIVAAVVVVSHS